MTITLFYLSEFLFITTHTSVSRSKNTVKRLPIIVAAFVIACLGYLLASAQNVDYYSCQLLRNYLWN